MNRNRPGGHSANELIQDDASELVAVRCNCGKHHPVSSIGTVFWEAEEIIYKKDANPNKRKQAKRASACPRCHRRLTPEEICFLCFQ